MKSILLGGFAALLVVPAASSPQAASVQAALKPAAAVAAMPIATPIPAVL